MICEKCNNQIDDDSKFCPFCGHKIEKNREEVEIYKSEENISNNIKKDLLSKDEELEINTNSKLKSIVFRIIAIILAYFGFMAVEIWLVGKGISFGETTLTSMFVFLAIYKIVVGYSLKIKSSKNMGIWFVIVSIILLFLDLR